MRLNRFAGKAGVPAARSWTRDYPEAWPGLVAPAPCSFSSTSTWQNEERLAARRLNAHNREVRCENGVLVIEGPTDFHREESFLVAKATELVRGLAGLIIPVRATLRSWYRFRIVSATE